MKGNSIAVRFLYMCKVMGVIDMLSKVPLPHGHLEGFQVTKPVILVKKYYFCSGFSFALSGQTAVCHDTPGPFIYLCGNSVYELIIDSE